MHVSGRLESPGHFRLSCGDTCNEDPPAGPVDCHKEISARHFIGHVWRVFHVNVDIAKLRCFGSTELRFVTLGLTVTKTSQTMPRQTMI